MAQTLRAIGFEVIERIDADQKEMKLAIFALGDRLEDAGKDAVGLFFYAGHGLQVGGNNYLVPLGATIEKEREVAIEAVSANWVLSTMKFAGNRMNFVILDACRNNPLTRSFRAATRGLARMDAPRGSLVAYSTAPGEVAADGKGPNSPYTEALVAAMNEPGVPVERMFRSVRNAVMERTDDSQVPWESSSLTGGDFFFNPATVVAAPEPSSPAPEPVTPSPDPAMERLFWETIKDSDDPAMFQQYLRQFPNGTFAGLARLKLDVLGSGGGEEIEFWETVKDSDDPAMFEEYLRTFPNGSFAGLARLKLSALAERQEEETRTAAVVPQADPDEIELAFWKAIEASTSAADYEAYIEQYPDGHFASLARARLAALGSGGAAAAPESQTAALTLPIEPGALAQDSTLKQALIEHCDTHCGYRIEQINKIEVERVSDGTAKIVLRFHWVVKGENMSGTGRANAEVRRTVNAYEVLDYETIRPSEVQLRRGTGGAGV